MEVLYFINSYIKYAYVLVGIGIFLSMFRLLKYGLLPLAKKAQEINSSLTDMNHDLIKIQKAGEKINYTMQNTLPLLVDLMMVFSLLKNLLSFRKRKSLGSTLAKIVYTSASSGSIVGKRTYIELFK